MRRAAAGGALGLAAAACALAGCASSAHPPRTPGSTTTGTTAVSSLGSCLQQNAARAGTLGSIPARLPGARHGQPRPRLALGFQTGGPVNSHGVIAESNLNDLSLYVFADAHTARRAAALAGPAVAQQARQSAARARQTGNPEAQPSPTSATAIGRTVLVYVGGTTFGAGSPIGSDELAAVRSCVRNNGLA